MSTSQSSRFRLKTLYKWYLRKTINTLLAPVAKACGNKNNVFIHTISTLHPFSETFFSLFAIYILKWGWGKIDCEQSQLLLICIVTTKIIYVLFFNKNAWCHSIVLIPFDTFPPMLFLGIGSFSLYMMIPYHFWSCGLSRLKLHPSLHNSCSLWLFVNTFHLV